MSEVKFFDSRNLQYTETVDELLANVGEKCIIMISADWCSPCKSIKPLIKAFKDGNKDINVHCININTFPVNECELTRDRPGGVPTFRFFKNGKMISEFSGANMIEFRRNAKLLCD